MSAVEANKNFDNILEISQDNKVVTDGPLSIMYADALNEIYAKQVDPITGIVFESQANDALSARNIWLATKIATVNFANQGEDVGMLYGVKKHSATLSDVVNVADSLTEMSDGQKENTVIIIDAMVDTTNSGAAQPEELVINPCELALEKLCHKHGVKVFNSLEQYLASVKSK
jgi:hypothetical protein